jgi:exonuclease SbcD
MRMRFVHTSDLHLGRKLAQMSLESDTRCVLEQLEELVARSKSQALVIAGDVFDAPNPPEAAARQWDRFITRMARAQVPVLVVSGNHDSGARMAVGADLIALSGVHIAGELEGALASCARCERELKSGADAETSFVRLVVSICRG